MGKRGRPPKNNPLDVENDIFVRADRIKHLVDPPISDATLGRYVRDGKVIKHSHGLYRLNATRKALGLPEEEIEKPQRQARPTKMDLAMMALSSVRKEIPDDLFYSEVEFMRHMVETHEENIRSMSLGELAVYINAGCGRLSSWRKGRFREGFKNSYSGKSFF